MFLPLNETLVLLYDLLIIKIISLIKAHLGGGGGGGGELPPLPPGYMVITFTTKHMYHFL